MNRLFFRRAAALFAAVIMLASLTSSFTSAADGFTDVPEGKWYAKPIAYVTEKGYFSGTGDGVFSPEGKMTRAMFVQVLAVISGDDFSGCTTDRFTDVPAGKWYAHAVAWADGTGIASGVADGIFSPDSFVTRETVCLMVRKLVDYKKALLRRNNTDTEPFADDAVISGWSREAVKTVRSWGLISGKTGNKFDPKGTATRAELAVIVMNLDMAMENAYKIDVKNIDVKISGLKKEYTFLHISDSHLTLTDETDSEAAAADQAVRGAMFLSETSDGISQEKRFADHMDYAREKDVDFIAMTGDIIDAPSNGNINCVSDAISDFGKETLFILGNHDWTGDWIGTYQSSLQRSNSIPKFAEAGMIKEDEDRVLIREYDEFVIIGIDDSNDQITDLEYNAVSRYISKRKPIILFLHVPVDVESFQEETTAMWGRPVLLGNPVLSPNSYTKMFVNLVKAPNSTVAAIFAGHIHIDHEDVFNEYTGAKQYSLGASFKGSCALVSIHG